MVQDII